MPEFVDNAMRDIDEQLRQLRDEVSRLEAARSALAGARHRPGRPRGSATRPTPSRTARTRTPRARAAAARTGRRASASPAVRSTRRDGTRATQTLELVSKRPGITIPQIAEAMKIQPNYLYRVLPRLASEGQVRRDGQGWHPAG